MPTQEARDCGKTHTFNYHGEEEVKKNKQVTDAELDAIIDRLYQTQTKSREARGASAGGKQNQKKDGKLSADVDKIVERLYTMKTEAMKESEQETPKSGKVVNSGELDTIVERLHTTHTASSAGDAKPGKPKNVIAPKPLSEEEIKEIFQRLLATHTKSSAGGACKTYEPRNWQGMGLKMWPIIEGLETRFMGKAFTEAQATEIMERLLSTDTGATKARKGFPRILLYPERTILHNNTSRIRSYQDNGTMSRQKELARREKWYN